MKGNWCNASEICRKPAKKRWCCWLISASDRAENKGNTASDRAENRGNNASDRAENKGNTASDRAENRGNNTPTVQRIRKILYRGCCTEDAVSKMLYRKCCIENAVSKMLSRKCCIYRRCCIGNAVSKMLYRSYCIENAVSKLLHWKCLIENVVSKNCIGDAWSKMLYRRRSMSTRSLAAPRVVASCVCVVGLLLFSTPLFVNRFAFQPFCHYTFHPNRGVRPKGPSKRSTQGRAKPWIGNILVGWKSTLGWVRPGAQR